MQISVHAPTHLLPLKSQTGTDLVARFIQLISIETQSQPNRGASIEFGTIRQGRNTAIIELDLGERERIELILRRHLQPTRFSRLHIIPSLDADFHGRVDFLVEASGEDAQVLDPRDAGAVLGRLIPKRNGISRHGRFLQIIARFTADEDALVAGGDVHDGVDVAVVVAVVEEGAGVDVGVLEGEGEFFRARDFAGGTPEVLEVDFHARGHDVGEFDFAVEDRGGGPAFGDGDACVFARQRDLLICAVAAVGDGGRCEVEG